MKVAFVHPDLGIGGAERLVVDCALAMKSLGHDVVIYTSYHDPKHAFEETCDGTLKVRVAGNIAPRHIGGRLMIFMAIIRQLNLTWSLSEAPDLFIVDQLPACIPWLRTKFPKSRVLFYCHHPDMVLADHKSLVKKIYRYPFDQFERWATLASDSIVVNSSYTGQVFMDTFHVKEKPEVVYPIVPSPQPLSSLDLPEALRMFNGRVLVSINRFEVKKNVELALEAYALLLHALPPGSRNHLLVIAGGYDPRVPENIQYLAELQRLARVFRLPSATILPGGSWPRIIEDLRVVFAPNVSSSVRDALIKRSSALLYTPTNEHFGIVPLEAMRAGTPVLATNTGGPLETVVDGETGWLRPPDVEEWMRVLKFVLVDASEGDLSAVGRKGASEVAARFGPKQLEQALNRAALDALRRQRPENDSLIFTQRLVILLVVSSLILGLVGTYFAVVFLLWVWPILAESTQW